MSRILLTGARSPAALELARQFAGGGATVVVADSASHWLTRSSRAVERAYQVPSPRDRPLDFADAIAAIVRHERITRIVPTCEEVFYLARFADALRPLAELFCPNLDVLRSLHDKWSLTRLVTGLGVEVPESWLLQTPADLAAVPADPAELVFKPVFSRFAVHLVRRPRPSQLLRLRPTPDQPWLAQRCIAGRELCSYSVALDGRLTAHATYEPTWRAGRYSSSFYFSPVDCPSIEHFAAQLVARVHYTGQIGFDFIQTPDGALYLLECNPRATSGVHLFSAADPLAAAFDGTAPGLIRPSSQQPRMLTTAMLLVGLAQAVQAGRLPAFLNDIRRAGDVLWSDEDPMPGVSVLVDLAAYLAVAVRHRLSPAAASTRDIEWNGQPIP